MDGFKKMNSYHHSQSLLLYHKKNTVCTVVEMHTLPTMVFFDKHCKSVESVL